MSDSANSSRPVLSANLRTYYIHTTESETGIRTEKIRLVIHTLTYTKYTPGRQTFNKNTRREIIQHLNLLIQIHL